MDAVTMKACVGELAPLLLQNRIEKIYQHGDHELYFKVKRAMVLISTHPTMFRIQNTFLRPEHPSSPPMFCMLLRKHLVNGMITRIGMAGRERVVTLTVENTDEMYQKTTLQLICELMGKHSNVILVGEDGVIIDSIKRVPFSLSSVRQVLPGLDYQSPPVREQQTDRSLEGMSRFLRQQIEQGRITARAVEEAIDHPQPCIIQKKHPSILPIPGLEAVEYDSLGRMLDDYYRLQSEQLNNGELIKRLQVLIGRAQNKIKVHQKELDADVEKYQLFGELLTSNLHQLGRGEKSARLLNYYTEEQVEIPLDPSLSPNENAQKYFKKYAKRKAGKEHAVAQMQKAREEIDFLEEAVLFLRGAGSEQEVDAIKNSLYQNGFLKRPKKAGKSRQSAPIVYHTNTGAEIWVGRNSQQNDQLTLKKANKDDLWFHVKDMPGSHVILSGRRTDEDSILQAAMIAAWHSKGREGENIPVDYTLVRHVKKPAHSLPGKVIYTDQKTLYITPDWNAIRDFTE